ADGPEQRGGGERGVGGREGASHPQWAQALVLVVHCHAAVAMMGDPKAFKSGREFAAFAGLVPRQVGTGGRVKLLGISKRGDTYLRTLLIHGARSVLTHAKDPGPWVTELRRRRPLNVAIVALANKMARTIWAVLAHERTYQKGFVSRPA
ncbi:MAG: transposase, partial [Burkholderiaceae bacterium]